MGSVTCLSIPHPQKIQFFRYDCWRTRRKPTGLPKSSIPLPTSVIMRYGSSSAIGTHTKPAVTSAWKPLRAVPKCQLGTDYGHCQKTTGTIQSQGPWDTLPIDIVGPLPPDNRRKFLIVFVDCFSKYTILVPSSNHTANTVSEALMHHVIPYFGTPHSLLSDRSREFISAIWTKLLRSLGIQQVLTSPHHPEGNAINKRSHRTLNNMLRACLLEGPSAKAWVDKVPGIMLTLNAMPH